MKLTYEKTQEFETDFKKLNRRFKTLPEDLETAKKSAIELFHVVKLNNQSTFPIPQFCFDKITIYKLKKFRCKSLKGKGVKSGIRIIYAFLPQEKKIIFIEIYFKERGDTSEDVGRIRSFIKNVIPNRK